MAAILTPTNLVVLQSSTLKHPPSTAEPTCSLPPLPSSLAWSAETNSIFLCAATGDVLQYDLSSGSLQDVCPSVTQAADHPVVSLLTKDRGNNVVFARGQYITVASSQTGKVAYTFDTHKALITSLSLSNDSSLLASTSARAIHVHNLTLASHTVLRGIPMGSGTISTCAFHPHSRTRLLVGLDTQLLVYDTTRPSGPVKVIPLDKDQRNIGPIVAITCSPFSKTLVAVGCSGGTVALVDMEKEKGLFRVLQMPAPLTCLSFSAEGAALYAGTENGKFLVLDLRALDKPPRSVTISANGDRVIAISIQRKLKPGEAQAIKAAASATTKPLVQRDINKTAPAPRRLESATGELAKKPTESKALPRTKSATITSTTPRRGMTRTASSAAPTNVSPGSRAVSGTKRLPTGASKSPVVARNEPQKMAFSPPKSPLAMKDQNGDADEDELSVRVENLLALPKAKEPAAIPIEDEHPISAVPRAPSALSRTSSRGQGTTESTKTRTHTRTASTLSRASTAESASAALPRSRAGSSASLVGRTKKASTQTVSAVSSRSASPPPPTAQLQRRRVSGSSVLSRLSRTPSPDLPGMEEDGGPVTPIPAYKMKGKERALGTSDVDEWIRAGEGKAKAADGGDALQKGVKRVEFAGDSDSEGDDMRLGHNGASDDSDSDEESAAAAAAAARFHPHAGLNFKGGASSNANGRLGHEGLAMQVSPRRSFAGPSPRGRPSGSWAAVPSPLRNPAAPASPQARAAQDMLQALLRDALHDFRQETKSEIVGLHLDLIRMGGSWRREMREAMSEVSEEIRALREENRVLREENERLRRGY